MVPEKLTRWSDPDTSFEAAERVIPKLPKLQQRVYQEFEAIYPRGMTDLDLQYRTDDHGSTYRTRRRELTVMGLIVNSGRKVHQEGGNRIVWVLARS